MGREELFGRAPKGAKGGIGSSRTAAASLLAERGNRRPHAGRGHRGAHNMQASASTYKDKFYPDDLAKLLGLPEWEKIWENVDFFDDRDEAEWYKRWANAVGSVAEQALGQHGMILVEKKGRSKNGTYFEIAPETNWGDAARKIIDTINGFGTFHFNSARELLESGPYKSPKEAVMRHLHWMRVRPEVYGDMSYRTRYDRIMR